MFCRNVDIKIISKTLNSVKHYTKLTAQLNFYAHKNDFVKKPRREDLIGIALENIPIKKPEDWGKVKEFILNHESNRNTYNSGNIDGMIMGCCATRLKRTDLAKTYLKYLEEQNKKPNLATIGSYLKLLYNNNIEKTLKDDEREILRLCEDIELNNPVLDSLTQQNMILALSLTTKWKKCLDLLQEIKLTATPSTPTYSAVVAAAFLNKEEQLGWNLLWEMLENERLPLSIAFQAYLKTLKRTKKQENLNKKIEKLFQFYQKAEIFCEEDIVQDIFDFYKNVGSLATVKFSGQCMNCNTKLDKFELTDEEFSELKEVFFKNVIVGRDIFIKSDPAEMREFQDFVSNMGKFDVVLDGLNIAYSAGVNKGPHFFSKLVAAVVSDFVKQNKTVLMLGRVHMKRWPKTNWNYITQNSTVFLTRNISQDDPYLLYCALHSGKNTTIVSRDLMRSHKFLLKERKYKILFDRWLSQRQYFLSYVNDQNKPFYRIPPHFTAIAQKKNNIWHIPYVPKSGNTINEKYHKTFLCLKMSD